jgi:hypothetical protein
MGIADMVMGASNAAADGQTSQGIVYQAKSEVTP